MRWNTLLASLTASVALTLSAGCLGDPLTPPDPGPTDPGPTDPGPTDPGPTDPGPTGNEGEVFFNANVKPLVAGCGVAGCHAGPGTDPLKFMGVNPADDSTFYTSIVNYAAVHGNWTLEAAALVTKLDLAAANGVPHYGYQPYTQPERDLIGQWFGIEKIARQGNPGDPGPVDPGGPVNTKQLFAEWSACMTIDDWNATQMYEWADKGSSEGPCVSCHNNGEHLFNTNNNDTTMFEMNRYEIFIIGFFAAQINPDGTGEIVPAYDKLVRMGQGNNLGSLHPTYNTDLNNDQRFQQLADFYAAVKARKDAGLCGPPGFPAL